MSSSFQGRVIADRYVLERVLGEGGMGVVYGARHRFTGGEVALKLLHRHVAADPELASRFQAEARAPAAIGHPGIVRVIDAGATHEGELYLVMELLHGETLRAWLARGRREPAALAAFVVEALDALGAAHAAGVIHRDLKPENVFLAAEPASLARAGGGRRSVRLLDFGIAKLVGAPAAGQATATGALMGTVAYMSPEQLKDTAHVDARTDLWSLAVILYEGLVGKKPFEAPSGPEMMVAILSRPPPPPSESVPHPPEVDAFFARALAADPAQRFASAGEMAAALRALPLGAAPAADALGPTEFAGSSAPPAAPTPPPTDEARTPARPARVQPIVVAALGLSVMCALAMVVAWFTVIRPMGKASRASRHVAPAAPSPSDDQDALCKRSCDRLTQCSGVTDPTCVASCLGSPDFRRCAKTAKDCQAMTLCSFTAACPTNPPRGTGTCKQATECQAACAATQVSPEACMCGCIGRLAPDRALDLYTNNACGGARCPSVCGRPLNVVACGTCFAQQCSKEVARCKAR